VPKTARRQHPFNGGRLARLFGKLTSLMDEDKVGYRSIGEAAMIVRIENSETGRIDHIGVTTRGDCSYVTHLQRLMIEAHDPGVVIDSLNAAHRDRMQGNKWVFPAGEEWQQRGLVGFAAEPENEKEEEEEDDEDEDAKVRDRYDPDPTGYLSSLKRRNQIRDRLISSIRGTRFLCDPDLPPLGFAGFMALNTTSLDVPSGDPARWEFESKRRFVAGLKKTRIRQLWGRKILI
jgi:hypothetical protein